MLDMLPVVTNTRSVNSCGGAGEGFTICSLTPCVLSVLSCARDTCDTGESRYRAGGAVAPGSAQERVRSLPLHEAQGSVQGGGVTRCVLTVSARDRQRGPVQCRGKAVPLGTGFENGLLGQL